MVDANKQPQNQAVPTIVLKASEVLDLVLAYENGDFPLVRLNGKIPIDKNWQNGSKKEYVYSHYGDIGYVVGELKSDDGETHWELIDIDLEPEVAELLVGTLLKKVGDYCIVFKTASDKYHLLFRVKGYHDMGIHELFSRYQFSDYFMIPEYRNKQIPKGKIEWFGLKKTIGARQIRLYNVSEFSKFNKLYDLPIITAKELKNKIEYALLDDGYRTYTPDIVPSPSELADNTNVSFVKPTNKQKIAYYHMESFAKFIIIILEHNDGNKHRIILALGNYLSSFVEKDSAIKLMETIIKLAPTLFKSNDDALRALLKGYDDTDDNKHKTGLRTIFKEYASDFMTAQQFYFTIIWYSGGRVGFNPTGLKGNQRKYIEFNRYTQQIEEQTIRHRKNDEEEYEEYIDSVKPIFGFEIVAIKRIENSIIPSANAEYCLEYIPSGMNKIHSVRANSMKEVQDKLKSQIGIVLGASSDKVFNQTVAFFTRNNLIEITNTSPVRGIFLINGELRRFDDNLNEIEAGFNKQKLVDALDLLEDIRDILPMDSDKMGNIVRKGLKMPFHFILHKKGMMKKYMSLLGAGKTGKTFLAELVINLYSPSLNTTNGNIFVAGSAASPYQFGRLYTLGSYPVVINECAKIFNDPELIEIMKSAVDSDIARDTHDATYYSYGSIIFTSNVDMMMKDAIVRRSDIFYFQPSERLSEDDISNLAELLNETGTNSRLVELNEIGQFIFTYLHDNIELFDSCQTTDEFELKLVEALENETGKDLAWLKQSASEDTELLIEEIDNETIFEFLGEIKKIYNFNFKAFHNYNYKDEDGVYYKPLMFNDSDLISLVSRGAIDFLVYDNNEDEIFIVGNRLKSFFQKQNKLITTKQLYEELEQFGEDYVVHERRMRIEGRQYRGIGISVDLLIDLLNNDIEKSEDDESDGLTAEEERQLARLLAKKEASKKDD